MESSPRKKAVVKKGNKVKKSHIAKVKEMSPKQTLQLNSPTTNMPAVSKPITLDGGSSCMDGMTGAELMMVRRLAGNDPVVRKKTLKKLKKWLAVIAQKVPDSPECRPMIEPNFIRIWKALFYCMWMADKPLPQEQLAESISDLQNIFITKNQPFLLFVEWFLRTMAREWSWIDRFRMDKFMMLFRRFLRKTLAVISEKKWHNDVLETFLKLISMYIFNRHPITKTKKNAPTPSTVTTPLGLQIHFTDIFMEELAKIGGEKLKFQKILKVLAPFIYELGHNNDDRLIDEIRERIFNHLMRQSDVGLDYQEQLAMPHGNIVEEEDEDTDDASENVELDADDTEHESAMGISSGPLDPRAGAIDVILPQLDIDYEKMYEKLVEFGGHKDIRVKNRRILYSIALQFKEITEGKYPFELPTCDEPRRAIPKKEITNAAKRLLEMESSDGEGVKIRKGNKGRKRDAKRKLNLSAVSIDSQGSEDDSKYIRDDEILDHVTDNYMSYLEDEVERKSSDDTMDDESSNDVVEQDSDEVDEPVSKKGKKKRKTKDTNTEEMVTPTRKRKYKTIVEVEADEQDNEFTITVDSSKNTVAPAVEEDEVIIKRLKPNKRRQSAGGNENSKVRTPLVGKSRRVSELARTPSMASPSPNKRVSFVLARNLEHEHADYPVSIARSPAIPFDSDKRPGSGLLKSPATPKPSLSSSLVTPNKRRRPSAVDFF